MITLNMGQFIILIIIYTHTSVIWSRSAGGRGSRLLVLLISGPIIESKCSNVLGVILKVSKKYSGSSLIISGTYLRNRNK